MTVSRVLNGSASVADQTRDRVERAVADLGYRANPAARVLAGGRSRVVGVVAVETQQFGPSQTLFAVEGTARSAGHSVSLSILARPDGADLRSAVAHLHDSHVDGIVVVAPVRSVVDAVAVLGSDLPIVVAGGDLDVSTPSVAIDQEAGARLAVDHLLDRGHQTVHHVSGPSGWIDAEARAKGWSDAIRRRGIRRGRRVAGDWTAQGGYAAGMRLATDENVTAVFAANDQTALGVLAAMHDAGRVVPDQVSVVGFDDIPESAYLVPALTTVRQDFIELGRRCVELVLGLIAGQVGECHVVVQPDLVIRDSSGPAAVVAVERSQGAKRAARSVTRGLIGGAHRRRQ